MIECLTPAAIAPSDGPAPVALAPGDRVIVTIHDWMTGEHELPGTVRCIDPTGRVVVDAGAGTQTLRLSCNRADVRLVEG